MKCLFYIAIGLLCATVSAGATTVKSFVFDGLCGTAQTILIAKCVDKKTTLEHSATPEQGRKGIYTWYRFAVLDVVKGQAEKEMTLVLPGGKYDGQYLEVSGMPQFEVGKETVLFLSEPDAYGSPWPVGLGQGCYGVKVNTDGQKQVAFEQHNPVDPTLRSKPAKSQQVPLEDFVGHIRNVLNLQVPVDESPVR